MAQPDEAPVLGIDLGGTKILTSVVTSKGKMLSRDHSVTPAIEGRDAIVRSIAASVRKALDEAKVDVNDLLAVGVGAPGPSNPETGVLYTSPNLPGLREMPIRDIIEREFGKKTFLINDANAAAVGEYHLGAGRGSTCFIYVTVSTGIGGGIVFHGKLYTGATGGAGEIGHITIDDNGPPCNCGNHGCWETLASGTAMAREARRRISAGVSTAILELAEGKVEAVSAQLIGLAAEGGDVTARDILARTSHYLGTGFASLINIFNPDVIAIGGGVANIGPMLLEPAYKVAGERAFTAAYEAVRFTNAELGRDCGVLGAAIHAFEEMRRLSSSS